MALCACLLLGLLLLYVDVQAVRPSRLPFTGCDPLSRTVGGVRYIRQADLDAGTYPYGAPGFVTLKGCP